MKRLVIVGGGFAGMWAALVAAREAATHGEEIRITLIAQDEYLTVRPRLYEVFTPQFRAQLTPVLAPLGIHLKVGTAQAIDRANRAVHVISGDHHANLHYDRLVLAAGSVQQPLNIPGAAEFALSIDTFAQAEAFDQHLQQVLIEPERPGRLTFVIVGAGFTGIEIAAEMRNRIRAHTNEETARQARVILVERQNVVGPDLGENPRPVIETALNDAKVEILLECSLSSIDRAGITLTNGERIDAATVIVTTGLRANPLAAQLGVETDRQGRLIVDDQLRLKGTTEIYAAGDIACAKVDDTRVALMSCQHAIPMGKHAGFNAAHDLLGSPLRTYRQPDYVTCLDLGDYGALFTMGWERKIENFGAEVKSLKRMVNTQWIYPPSGSRDAILLASDIDAPWPPAV